VTDKEEKARIKRQKKDAELRTILAEAAMTELDLERKIIENESYKKAAAAKAAMPSETGKFFFPYVVTDMSMQDIRERLFGFADRYPGEPIELAICSPGGSVFAGLSIYASLRELSDRGHHITTVVSGWAASMGGVLLQAGDHRVMGAESLLMLHEVSALAIGKGSEIKDEAAFLDRVTRQACQIYARRSTMTEDEIMARIERRDWWLWPEEALEVGFVDEVR
jgi:ATP-dependent Clp endopeptidase proteolytic subunit ClpP